MPNMTKGDDVREVHPDLVDAMTNEGWELDKSTKPATKSNTKEAAK